MSVFRGVRPLGQDDSLEYSSRSWTELVTWVCEAKLWWKSVWDPEGKWMVPRHKSHHGILESRNCDKPWKWKENTLSWIILDHRPLWWNVIPFLSWFPHPSLQLLPKNLDMEPLNNHPSFSKGENIHSNVFFSELYNHWMVCTWNFKHVQTIHFWGSPKRR